MSNRNLQVFKKFQYGPRSILVPGDYFRAIPPRVADRPAAPLPRVLLVLP
jgi:hypothetical protein